MLFCDRLSDICMNQPLQEMCVYECVDLLWTVNDERAQISIISHFFDEFSLLLFIHFMKSGGGEFEPHCWNYLFWGVYYELYAV